MSHSAGAAAATRAAATTTTPTTAARQGRGRWGEGTEETKTASRRSLTPTAKRWLSVLYACCYVLNGGACRYFHDAYRGAERVDDQRCAYLSYLDKCRFNEPPSPRQPKRPAHHCSTDCVGRESLPRELTG